MVQDGDRAPKFVVAPLERLDNDVLRRTSACPNAWRGSVRHRRRAWILCKGSLRRIGSGNTCASDDRPAAGSAVDERTAALPYRPAASDTLISVLVLGDQVRRPERVAVALSEQIIVFDAGGPIRSET